MCNADAESLLRAAAAKRPTFSALEDQIEKVMSMFSISVEMNEGIPDLLERNC